MDEYSVLERCITRLEDERQIERLKPRYTAYCDAGYDADVNATSTQAAPWTDGSVKSPLAKPATA
jgi:hypothetical protein